MDNIVRDLNSRKNTNVSFKGVKILCGVIVFYIATTIPTGACLFYFIYTPMAVILVNNVHYIFQYMLIVTLSNGIFHPIIHGYGQKGFRKELVKQWQLLKGKANRNESHF